MRLLLIHYLIQYVSPLPRMKRNLHNICSLHSSCLHGRELNKAHVHPQVILVVAPSQLAVLHQAPVQEQLVQIAALMELLQLPGPVHNLELE